MANEKVVFAGIKGAFGELAAQKYFGDKANISPVEDFAGVFNAVKRGRADYGVVPIENSMAGSIHQNYDLLLESKLYITAEISLRVNHCLVAKRGTTLANVKKILSHPQALSQCRKFLKGCSKVKTEEVSNTALAAKTVAESKSKDVAAIASSVAAADYGLAVIAQNIEDRADNITRFLVISKFPSNKGKNARKTSIVFSIKNTPGGLFKSLGVFALRDINLIKIESRPVRTKGFEYFFYLDCQGDIFDTELKNAIAHLKEIATFYRLLGSYDVGKE